jgi:hypothetical protein
MSAGHSASPQVRRTAQAAPARPAQTPVARSQFAFAVASDADDEIRINLGDVPLPRQDNAMHVEGFKPSLLSRLLDLVMPLR